MAVTTLVALVGACSSGPSATGPKAPTPGGSGMPSPSASGQGPTTPPSPGAERAPTSYDLINQRLAANEIGDEQALVYKVLASFDDPRLPAEFKGDDAELHDGLVIAEALARWDTLSAEAQQTLAPFTLWPGDAGSWLQQRVAGQPRAAVGMIAQADDAILPVESSTNVRVWYRTSRPQDKALAESIAQIVDSKVWPQLTGLMGPPLSDLGLGSPTGNGEDPRIDIVLSGEAIRSFARPFDCHQTSGFIQLGIEGTNLHTVSHELMHVIEFKYPVSSGCQVPEYIWLHEAISQWAMDYVDPTTHAERGKTGLLPKACFLTFPEYPLSLRNDCHEYGAYLFFQYLSKSYAPTHIPQVWEAAAGEGSLGAINSVVASAGGLAEVWPDFALAAYNVDPSTRFQQWDGFPFGALVDQTSVALGGSSSREFNARGDVPFMAASYTGFRFEDPLIKKVTFSHPFTGNPAARVTAVVKFEGESWKVEDWTPEPTMTWCFDDPGQKRIEQLVVIISNSNPEGVPLAGETKLVVEDSCSCGEPALAAAWTGTLNFQYDKSGGEVEVHRSGTLNLTLDEVYLDEADAKTWLGRTAEGSATKHDIHHFPDSTNEVEGGPIVRARSSLILDKLACSFTFNISVYVTATFNEFGETFEAEANVAEITLNGLAGGASGVSADLQAVVHATDTGEFGESTFQLVGAAFGDSYGIELAQMVGEDGLGTAAVQLNLTPTLP